MFKGVVPAAKLMGRTVYDSPITKQVLETAKRSALEAGLNVATDALEGKNVKVSLKGNMTAAKKKVSDSLVSALKRARTDTQHSDDGPASDTSRAKKRVKVKPPRVLAGVRRAKQPKNTRRSRDLFDAYY